MQLAHRIKNDISAAKKMRLSGWQLCCWMAGCALIVWPLNHSGRLDLALPILNTIAVLGFLIALKWKLRRHAWFWITILIIGALHIPLILFVPWTAKWVPAIAIAAMDSGDFILILTILSVLGNLLGERTTTSSQH
jgi:hypothetical protein